MQIQHKKGCLLLFILSLSTACDVLQQAVQDVSGLGLNVNPNQIGVTRLLEEKPPITTSFETDALTELTLLDDFNPAQALFTDANLLPRTENGGYVLREGLFFLETKSYCIKAGTYGPSEGDGYIYAPLKGPKENIIRKIVEKSYDNAQVTQQEVQELIWAIIAQNKFSDMPEARKKTAYKLLNILEIQQIDGGLWGLVPENIKAQAMQAVSPGLQKIYNAENQMRNLLNNASVTYKQLESVAVLTGTPTWGETIRPTPGGRWSYHPNGFFIRFFPRAYQNTRVELYVPSEIEVESDEFGKISAISFSDKLKIQFNYNKTPDIHSAALKHAKIKSLTFFSAYDRDPLSEELNNLQVPYNSVNANVKELDKLEKKFNINFSQEDKIKIVNLNLYQKALLHENLKYESLNTLDYLLGEANRNIIYRRLKKHAALKKTTNINTGNKFIGIIDKVKNLNQFKFADKHQFLDRGGEIIYDPIENVATPAITSKQRLLISPMPGIFSELPDCPCHYDDIIDYQKEKGGEWLKCGSANQFYHYGAIYEIRWRPDKDKGIAGQQCTYDASKNLITSGIAAGTPDIISPRACHWYNLSGALPSGILPFMKGHIDYDVYPWEKGNTTRISCKDYMLLWEPNKGRSACLSKKENEISGFKHMNELIGDMTCEEVLLLIRKAKESPIDLALRNFLLAEGNPLSKIQIVQKLENWKDLNSCFLFPNEVICLTIDKAILNLKV